MKKLFIALLFLPAFVRSQNTFQKTFDLGNDDEFLCGINTSDGGYLACGYSTVPFGGTAVKLNVNGAIMWAKTVGGQKISEALQTSWGGYYLAGVNTVSSNSNFYLCKIDGSGTLLWEKTFGKTSEMDELHSMVQTPDGGLIMSGYSDTINGAGFRPIAYVIKTDSNGVMQWERFMGGGTGGEEFAMVKPVSTGGYLGVGYTGSYGSAVGTECYAVRFNDAGTILWTRAFGDNTRFDRINDFVEFPGNCFFVAGYGYYTSTTDNVLLAKLDTSGNFLWQKNYEEWNGALSLIRTADDKLLMGGYYINQALGLYNDSYLIKTDTSGTILWAKEIGAPGVDDRLYGVIETPDAGFFIAGSNYGATNGKCSWIVKTDANGSSGCRDSAVTIPVTSLSILTYTGGNAAPAYYASSFVIGQLTANYTATTFCSYTPLNVEDGSGKIEDGIFPNPSSGIFTLTLNEKSEVIIYDILGKEVSSCQYAAGTHEIDLSEFPSGIYMLNVMNANGEMRSEKVVIQK